MCYQCVAIPTITIQLLVTSISLILGQRVFYKKSERKWLKRITFAITILISLVLSCFGIFLLILKSNNDYRDRNFANSCTRKGLKGSALDEHRCSILQQGGVTGNVLEFGPGPGTNFKCLQNYTSSELQSINKYVAVEPNSYFEEEMRKEHTVRGLAEHFPLTFVALKGEEVDDVSSNEYDVVILTHVLCSVDSVESVLANAERALKSGGRIIFMEHVVADTQTLLWYSQQFLVAPILNIVGNGCQFRSLKDDIESYSGDRFNMDIIEFEAPLPVFMFFARPHIKGILSRK